ncbi:MAG: hypothetical protein ACREVL_01100 [Solimonas sp.]
MSTAMFQVDTAEAAARRELGIQRAAEHATHIDPDWLAEAAKFVAAYAETHVDFLAEDVIAASAGKLASPPDGRAWGAVLRRAAAARVIRKIGFHPARTSNLSPKVLWGSLVLDLHAPLALTEWMKLATEHIRAFRAAGRPDAFFTEELTVYACQRGCPVPAVFQWWHQALEACGLAVSYRPGNTFGRWMPATEKAHAA